MYVGSRDLRRARGRFVLVASVIALITLLTVILSGLTAGLGADSASAIRALPGTTVVFATSPGASPSFDTSTITAADLAMLAASDGSGHVEGLGISQPLVDTQHFQLVRPVDPIAAFQDFARCRGIFRIRRNAHGSGQAR